MDYQYITLSGFAFAMYVYILYGEKKNLNQRSAV